MKRLHDICCKKNENGIYIVDDLGWISEKEFCIWVSHYFFNIFMDKVKEILDFSDNIDAKIQEDNVCIILTSKYEIEEIEEVFPKAEFIHNEDSFGIL